MISKDRKSWILENFNTEDVRKFWNAIKRLTKGQNMNPEFPDLMENGNVASTPEAKSELLRVQYEKVWSTEMSWPRKVVQMTTPNVQNPG
jgi:hypothetical protein